MDYTERIENIEYQLDEESNNWEYSLLILADAIYWCSLENNQQLLTVLYWKLRDEIQNEMNANTRPLEWQSVDDCIRKVREIYSKFVQNKKP